MTAKMTNKKAIAYVLENCADIPADVREKLEKILLTFEKKAATGERKPTAKQIENEAFRVEILEMLAENPNQIYTCADIANAIKGLNGVTNQRITGVMRPLVEGGKVAKTTKKGQPTTFQIAEQNKILGLGDSSSLFLFLELVKTNRVSSFCINFGQKIVQFDETHFL